MRNARACCGDPASMELHVRRVRMIWLVSMTCLVYFANVVVSIFSICVTVSL